MTPEIQMVVYMVIAGAIGWFARGKLDRPVSTVAQPAPSSSTARPTLEDLIEEALDEQDAIEARLKQRRESMSRLAQRAKGGE